MRLFGGELLQTMMNTLGVDETMPIENKMLSNTIESSQRKVEGRNFGIRKNVLQFDDVMNRQREIIYGQREKVLDGESLKDSISGMIDELIDVTVANYLPEGVEKDQWNIEGLRDYFFGWLITNDDLAFDRARLAELGRDEILAKLKEHAHAKYEERERELGEEVIREVERVVLLKNVDRMWMDHIDAMDELKKGIYLRSYAQKDPVVEYRLEGFDMFDQMVASIREQTVKAMFVVRVRTGNEPKREQVAKPSEPAGDGTLRRMPKKSPKPGRNDPCPCGSGKKYKKCCGAGQNNAE